MTIALLVALAAALVYIWYLRQEILDRERQMEMHHLLYHAAPDIPQSHVPDPGYPKTWPGGFKRGS